MVLKNKEVIAKDLFPAQPGRFWPGAAVDGRRSQVCAGCQVPTHAHRHEQVSYVVSGKIELSWMARPRFWVLVTASMPPRMSPMVSTSWKTALLWIPLHPSAKISCKQNRGPSGPSKLVEGGPSKRRMQEGGIASLLSLCSGRSSQFHCCPAGSGYVGKRPCLM
jgi:hypothetical protein